MRRNSAWNGPVAAVSPLKAAKPVACLLLVTAMGAAFWAGVLFVTLPLLK